MKYKLKRLYYKVQTDNLLPQTVGDPLAAIKHMYVGLWVQLKKAL